MRQAPSETMDPRLVRHTDSLVCVQGSGGECIFLIPVQSPLAHNAPISIPKVSLVFPCLSRGAHSRDYLLSLLSSPGFVSSKLLVLASQSSGPQDAKSPPITLLVYFHEASQRPGISPPHE